MSYRSGNPTTNTTEPLLTMATKTAAGIARPADGPEFRVEDCHFRMLTPREQLRSQWFPDTYRAVGTMAEQTMQAGKAVSANTGPGSGASSPPPWPDPRPAPPSTDPGQLPPGPASISRRGEDHDRPSSALPGRRRTRRQRMAITEFLRALVA